VRGAAAAIVVATVLVAARASGAEDAGPGASPWFPVVDPQVGPQKTFELNTLEIIRVGEDGWRADRGMYRASLTRHDFYVMVGRTDLASSMNSATTTSSVLRWTGYGAVAAGGVLFYEDASRGGVHTGWMPFVACVGGGAILVMVSNWFTGPSVSPAEAAEMADRYNKLLRAHIEQETGDESPKPVQAVFRPHLVPWTDGREGGLVAFATF
jgi:hypothetical protein